VYVCSCFGVTEAQVHAHKAAGACTPRDVASACKAGTDCGSCVRRIQALLGRGGGCVSRSEIQARLTPGTAAAQGSLRVGEPVASVALAAVSEAA
jgi:bacterioferritin-associated ferredoxin